MIPAIPLLVPLSERPSAPEVLALEPYVVAVDNVEVHGRTGHWPRRVRVTERPPQAAIPRRRYALAVRSLAQYRSGDEDLLVRVASLLDVATLGTAAAPEGLTFTLRGTAYVPSRPTFLLPAIEREVLGHVQDQFIAQVWCVRDEVGAERATLEGGSHSFDEVVAATLARVAERERADHAHHQAAARVETLRHEVNEWLTSAHPGVELWTGHIPHPTTLATMLDAARSKDVPR